MNETNRLFVDGAWYVREEPQGPPPEDSQPAGVTLASLVGLHMLDAIDMDSIAMPRWEGDESFEPSAVCRFRLDGTLYSAIEDPNDGYRSSMRDLRVGGSAPIRNVFGPVQVLCVYRDKQGYHESDLLEFYDAANGKLVLTVGTDNSDDYYPSYVAAFRPEAMSINDPSPSTHQKT